MKILVTGATGQQGGSVARSLLASGFRVRALTRDSSSAAAVSLGDAGMEVVAGSFADPASLRDALAGVDGAFLVTSPFEGGVAAESEHGIAFVEAAAATAIRHLVFSSVSDADRATGVPHFDSKYRVEEHIRGRAVNATIVAPAYFYDNVLAPFMLPGVREGVLALALPPTTVLQAVSVRDIGRMVTLAFSKGDDLMGARLNIAGDELTGPEFAAALTTASGHTVEFQEQPIDGVRQVSEDMALMYEWFESTGYSADIEGLRGQYPEVEWERFGDWASRQDWSALAA